MNDNILSVNPSFDDVCHMIADANRPPNELESLLKKLEKMIPSQFSEPSLILSFHSLDSVLKNPKLSSQMNPLFVTLFSLLSCKVYVLHKTCFVDLFISFIKTRKPSLHDSATLFNSLLHSMANPGVVGKLYNKPFYSVLVSIFASQNQIASIASQICEKLHPPDSPALSQLTNAVFLLLQKTNLNSSNVGYLLRSLSGIASQNFMKNVDPSILGKLIGSTQITQVSTSILR